MTVALGRIVLILGWGGEVTDEPQRNYCNAHHCADLHVADSEGREEVTYYWRARHLGGGVVQLYEAHATDDDCRDFCAARKKMINTPVKFFPIAISEDDLPAKDAQDA